MKTMIKTFPIVRWSLWYYRRYKTLRANKGKGLKIFEGAQVVRCELGECNTFFENVLVNFSKFGSYTYVARDARIFNAEVGNFCSIGPGCKIGLGIHPVNLISTYPSFFSFNGDNPIKLAEKNYAETTRKITIGSDVWIGANAIVLDGITIGNGAVVAAGAVVTKNVHDYEIVGGVPAKLIKKRFDEQQIAQLLQLRWWDKDINWLMTNLTNFNDPEAFFNKIMK